LFQTGYKRLINLKTSKNTMGKKKGPKQKKKYDSDEEENVEEETVVAEEPKQPEKEETPAPVEAPTPAKEEPKVDKPATAYPAKVEYCKGMLCENIY
jgi:hypothetical protein